jgi:hypothetical protein
MFASKLQGVALPLEIDRDEVEKGTRREKIITHT